MFGSIGFPELVMIFIVALLLFGPKQLPNLGRTLGRALAEFKRASNDLQRTLEEEVRAEELREIGRQAQEATELPGVLSPMAREEAPTGDPVGRPSEGTAPEPTTHGPREGGS